MSGTEEMYLYWLLNVPGIGRKKAEYLIESAGSAEAVYKSGYSFLNEIDYLSQRDKQALQIAFMENAADKYKSLLKKNILFLPIKNANYPERLRDIPDPPYVLYVKGEVPGEQSPSVAIIGARECSAYGIYVARELGKRLAMEGIQVISGLARGIDSEAQQAAVLAGGRVFGVLGCGVDICYPKGNQSLYEKLSREGGIMSEYAPGTQPKSSLFPSRNRIISGLADVVVVVEAKEKSGTLITVDMALEQGKEVYVVPGRVTDPMSVGCNRLIKQGAGILYCVDDFIEEVFHVWQHKRKNGLEKEITGKRERISSMDTRNIFLPKKEPESSVKEGAVSKLGDIAEKIVQLLDIKPKTMQQIYSELAVSDEVTISELSELLFEMENVYIIYKKDLFYFLNIKKV